MACGGRSSSAAGGRAVHLQSGDHPLGRHAADPLDAQPPTPKRRAAGGAPSRRSVLQAVPACSADDVAIGALLDYARGHGHADGALTKGCQLLLLLLPQLLLLLELLLVLASLLLLLLPVLLLHLLQSLLHLLQGCICGV